MQNKEIGLLVHGIHKTGKIGVCIEHQKNHDCKNTYGLMEGKATPTHFFDNSENLKERIMPYKRTKYRT